MASHSITSRYRRRSYSYFLSFLRILYIIGRVDRIILDEVYLLLTVVYYRKGLPTINSLRQIHISLVCITATLSSFASFELEKQLDIIQYERLRASSNRPNFKFRI